MEILSAIVTVLAVPLKATIGVIAGMGLLILWLENRNH